MKTAYVIQFETTEVFTSLKRAAKHLKEMYPNLDWSIIAEDGRHVSRGVVTEKEIFNHIKKNRRLEMSCYNDRITCKAVDLR